MRRETRSWFAPGNEKGPPASGPSVNNRIQNDCNQYTRTFAPSKRGYPWQRAAFWHNALQLAGSRDQPKPLPVAPCKPTGPVAPIDWRIRPRTAA